MAPNHGLPSNGASSNDLPLFNGLPSNSLSSNGASPNSSSFSGLSPNSLSSSGSSPNSIQPNNSLLSARPSFFSDPVLIDNLRNSVIFSSIDIQENDPVYILNKMRGKPVGLEKNTILHLNRILLFNREKDPSGFPDQRLHFENFLALGNCVRRASLEDTITKMYASTWVLAGFNIEPRREGDRDWIAVTLVENLALGIGPSWDEISAGNWAVVIDGLPPNLVNSLISRLPPRIVNRMNEDRARRMNGGFMMNGTNGTNMWNGMNGANGNSNSTNDPRMIANNGSHGIIQSIETNGRNASNSASGSSESPETSSGVDDMNPESPETTSGMDGLDSESPETSNGMTVQESESRPLWNGTLWEDSDILEDF